MGKDKFKITDKALEAMYEHCERDYPNEACGYLIGGADVADEVVPMRNAHQSPTSYTFDQKELPVTERRIREKGKQKLAIYHSHVATQAYPSRRDINHATTVQDFYEGHYVLVTLKDPGRPAARAFRIRDSHVTEDAMELRT